jgi:3-dehydroquinate synthase/shikimate kinase/3-dehydroquinate synthase
MAKIVSVGKGSSRYDVIIAKNAMNKKNLSNHLKNKNKVLIITDSGIPKKYIKELKIILDKQKVMFIRLRKAKSQNLSTHIKLLQKN